ncbi:MAG: hypothetical protein ACREJN_21505 [Nitrospiraceae bacterium]
MGFNLKYTSRQISHTLHKIFMPWSYYHEMAQDEILNTLHPEFGSYWQKGETGALLLQQAFDEGYKRGMQEGFKTRCEVEADYNPERVRGTDGKNQ